jgi:flagellar biosynthetic protein FlhB
MAEKTEDPTPKKRREAREEGNVAKSNEFAGAMVMTGVFGALVVWMPSLFRGLADLMRQSIRVSTRIASGESVQMTPLIEAMGLEMLRLLSVPLAVAFVAAAFFSYVQIGALFSPKVLLPKLERIDPGGGLKRLFEPAKLVELAKNVGKLGVQGAIAYMVLRGELDDIVRLGRLELFPALQLLAGMVFKLVAALGGGLLFFGVLDLVWQRHRHEKKLKMSKKEIEREYKESEGDPQQKSKRKQMHREMLEDPGVGNVGNADAVVVNPTHVAVALRYDRDQEDAPRVLARGRGEVAKNIKRKARKHGIPVIRNVQLARALVDLDVDTTIPGEFFEPVAELLTYVYSLREEE